MSEAFNGSSCAVYTRPGKEASSSVVNVNNHGRYPRPLGNDNTVGLCLLNVFLSKYVVSASVNTVLKQNDCP